MKLIIILFAFFIFIVSLQAKPLQPAKDTWKTYTIVEGFSCEMPGEPERDTTYQKADGELIKDYSINYISDDNNDKNLLYSVNYGRLSMSKDTLADSVCMRNLYNTVVEGFRKNGLDVLNSEFLKFKGYYVQTINTRARGSKDLVVMRYMFFQNGFAIAMVRVGEKYQNNDNLIRFFNSIEIREKGTDKTSATNDTTIKWKPVIGSKGSFTALLPGQFYQDSSANMVKGAYLKMIKYSCIPETSKDPNNYYEIRHIAEKIHPDTLASEDFRKRVFESVVLTTANESKTAPVFRKEMVINGIPCCEWSIHREPDDAAVKSRCFLFREGMIVAFARTSIEYDSNATMMKFLNSFTFTENDSALETNRSPEDITWEEYYTREGDLGLEFPCMPAVDSSYTPVLSLDIKNYSYSCQPDASSDSNTAYKCFVQFYPPEVMEFDSTMTPRGYVKKILYNLENSPELEIVRTTPLEIINRGVKIECTEIVINNKSENITTRGRLYCLSDRVIQLVVAAPPGVQENENMMRFFNSLNIYGD